MNKDTFGFRLIEKRFVKEVNAECLHFEHIKSGAKLLKIAAEDPNKTFCIAFKTFPESDNGAPHIMEHSLLNGSVNFPVKSPFDVLIKGSLHTFLNALTSKDVTMYPVASMNQKDYFNLMHVYLDAVFNPMIYKDTRILKQEGWHHELEDPESPVVYKGVVYNEMKGSFSNPVRELWYQVFKILFPDNAYGFESGGYPATIPTLTQEDFIAFHKRYYHPENSYIYLYGDGDLKKELEFIDKEYLSTFERVNKPVIITEQEPFTAMKEITGYYPFMEGSSIENQAFLSLNYVAGSGIDKTITMALDLLCEVLVNQESAPVRLALQKEGIGEDVSASSNSFQQNVVQILVQNANPKDKNRFHEIVNSTLKEIAEKGLDKKEVEGVLNRMEFQLREGNDAQKGFTYINQSFPGFMFANDPFIGLEYEKPLAEMKKALQTTWLESLIPLYFINNPHSLLLTLEPKPGLDNEKNEAVESGLKEYKSNLDNAALTLLVKETQDLIAFQKREDSPEALETIPMLDLKDIDPVATWYSVEETRVNDTTMLYHEEFTNDVIYMNLFFDGRTIPSDMIPYASLLSTIIGLMDTKNYSYGELNQALNIHTGGFFTSLNTFLENHDDLEMIPKFKVTSKVMNTKSANLFELTGEILNNTKYGDTNRLKTLLARHHSQLDAAIKRSGNRYAGIRLGSYYSNQGLFREMTEGLEYFWFISDLNKNFDKKADQIKAKLEHVASLLFTKENLVVASTCNKKDLDGFSNGLMDFLSNLPAGRVNYHQWVFNPEKKNEGIETASEVQYVMEGYNFKKLGYAWNGKMRVLGHILSTDWLQSRIRVIGGAYGGYTSVSPDGSFTFNSYRDPNLKETLENYRSTVEYLRKFEADQKSMTRYIIGTIARIDQPMTPSQKGAQAASTYFTKRKKEDLQRDRDAILTTTAEDIREFSEMIQKILDQNAICVYGNAEKINQEKELFDNIIKLEKNTEYTD
jgi:Zn-dependent M16 (insulinase) family peptidase